MDFDKLGLILMAILITIIPLIGIILSIQAACIAPLLLHKIFFGAATLIFVILIIGIWQMVWDS